MIRRDSGGSEVRKERKEPNPDQIITTKTRPSFNNPGRKLERGYCSEIPTECLEKDRETLLTFYDFPAEHWKHLRTTNPIESTFATVRLRHRKTKGNGSRAACLAMVFKLARSA